MIVKIQLSQFPKGKVLIYNKSRALQYEGKATKELMKILAGEQKGYFHARLDKQKRFVIDAPANWQEW